MRFLKKSTILVLISCLFATTYAQSDFNFDDPSQPYLNTITVAVPFLTINPDSRGGGMGDLGVASSADVASQHHNPAKYVFNDKDFGIGVSYVPWLQGLVSDINMAYLSGYYKVTDNDAIAFSLRYFNMGSIQFTDVFGTPIGDRNPNEFAVDFTYARKLTDEFSMAITPRFIYSNLASGTEVSGVEAKPGLAGAADLSLFYEEEFRSRTFEESTLRVGLNISNIGSKISYSQNNTRDFIPTTLRLGVGYTMGFDKYNKLSVMGEVSKLLVPTPPVPLNNVAGGDSLDAAGNKVYYGNGQDITEMGSISGLFRSFYDAPGGISEEMREITGAIGLEYAYREMLFVRAGTFLESKYKGNRKYATVGVGVKYNVFAIDVSYLFSFTQLNPLENTLHFSLTFEFDN